MIHYNPALLLFFSQSTKSEGQQCVLLRLHLRLFSTLYVPISDRVLWHSRPPSREHDAVEKGRWDKNIQLKMKAWHWRKQVDDEKGEGEDKSNIHNIMQIKAECRTCNTRARVRSSRMDLRKSFAQSCLFTTCDLSSFTCFTRTMRWVTYQCFIISHPPPQNRLVYILKLPVNNLTYTTSSLIWSKPGKKECFIHKIG